MKTLKQILSNDWTPDDVNDIIIDVKEWLTQKRQKYAEEIRSQFPYETIDELLEELRDG